MLLSLEKLGDFRIRSVSRSDVAGVAKSELDSDCTCVSNFSRKKHSFLYGLELWEEDWIFTFNKTVWCLTSLLRKVFSLSASASFIFKISFSMTKYLSQIISERPLLWFVVVLAETCSFFLMTTKLFCIMLRQWMDLALWNMQRIKLENYYQEMLWNN